MKSEHRLAALIMLWVTFAVMGIITLTEAGGNVLVMGILAFMALMITYELLDDKDQKKTPVEQIEKSKRTGDHSTVETLLDLLDEDDIRELRARVKQRLMDNIERGSDGELDSLSALLAEQEDQHRKRE